MQVLHLKELASAADQAASQEEIRLCLARSTTNICSARVDVIKEGKMKKKKHNINKRRVLLCKVWCNVLATILAALLDHASKEIPSFCDFNLFFKMRRRGKIAFANLASFRIFNATRGGREFSNKIKRQTRLLLDGIVEGSNDP